MVDKRLDKGIYVLELIAYADFTIPVKKFINHNFAPGYYYYVGSAQKNLQKRIRRHIRSSKVVHWHIDHLTTHPEIRITNVYIIPNAVKHVEWKSANYMIDHFKCQISVKGFGNSDTNKTVTHLLYRKKRIHYNHFISVYQSIVRLRPSSIEIS